MVRGSRIIMVRDPVSIQILGRLDRLWREEMGEKREQNNVEEMFVLEGVLGRRSGQEAGVGVVSRASCLFPKRDPLFEAVSFAYDADDADEDRHRCYDWRVCWYDGFSVLCLCRHLGMLYRKVLP
jgi:hypothetical protein